MAYGTYTLLEFQERFQTEEDCVKQLETVKWREGFVCPRCSGQNGCRLTDRREMPKHLHAVRPSLLLSLP